MGIWRETWKETVLLTWTGFAGGILGSTITSALTVQTKQAHDTFIIAIISIFIITFLVVFITKNYKK